jgi:hypothetical protein
MKTKAYSIFAGTMFGIGTHFIINFIMMIIFSRSISQDSYLRHWQTTYRISNTVFKVISVVFSFKLIRCYYSKFFGL